MALHLTFADGSNPYFFRGSKKAVMRELRKWRKDYNIDGVYTRMGIYFGTATLKRQRVGLFEFV